MYPPWIHGCFPRQRSVHLVFVGKSPCIIYWCFEQPKHCWSIKKLMSYGCSPCFQPFCFFSGWMFWKTFSLIAVVVKALSHSYRYLPLNPNVDNLNSQIIWILYFCFCFFQAEKMPKSETCHFVFCTGIFSALISVVFSQKVIFDKAEKCPSPWACSQSWIHTLLRSKLTL